MMFTGRMIKNSAFIFFLLLFSKVNATHIAGAEIFYEHGTGVNNYKFTLKVYRDCKECKFNNIGGGTNTSSCNEVPNLLIKGAVGTNYAGNDFGSISI